MNANDLRSLLRTWAQIMAENKDKLIELDSVAGDSDLGLTMSDGFAAAAEAAEKSTETDVGKLSYFAGKAMASAVPSTMGTLMASGLMNAGKQLKGRTELDAAGEAEFFDAYAQGVAARGKAQVGDKTFLDGLMPAVEVLRSATGDRIEPSQAQAAADAAHNGFLNTKGMIAKHGRMAIRGEASRDLYDPGSAVADLLMQGFARFTAQ